MPPGSPVATFSIGKWGSTNAAIFAAQIVAAKHPEVRDRIRAWRESRARDVLSQVLPQQAPLP
jgi:5-(carboxyamino)imidazole ribonucleotide mutase